MRPSLEAFRDRKPGEIVKLSKEQVPGLVESGWDPDLDEMCVTAKSLGSDSCSIRQPKRNPHYAVLQQVLNDLQNDPSAWPFMKPVDSGVVTDYYSVIKNPMGMCRRKPDFY